MNPGIREIQKVFESWPGGWNLLLLKPRKKERLGVGTQNVLQSTFLRGDYTCCGRCSLLNFTPEVSCSPLDSAPGVSLFFPRLLAGSEFALLLTPRREGVRSSLDSTPRVSSLSRFPKKRENVKHVVGYSSY